MRIAIVTNTAWNILNFRLPLVNVLRQDGHEVFAFCPEGDEVEAIRGAGIDWRPIKNLQRRGRNPLRDLLLGYELARLYRSEKISVALHYTIKPVIFGSIAANLSGVKIINTITGLGYTFVNLSFTQELVKLLYQLALGLADHTLFHNKDDLALFLKEGLVKRRPVGIVPGSGLDLNYFGYVPLKKEDKYRVLFIGRFLKDKGISEYADAARILKVEQKQSIEFLLLGSIDEGNPAAISTETLEHWLTTGLF
jgi:glycosyltransferase involved in cell wall biosynthesis